MELDEGNEEELESKILPPCGRQNDRGEAVVRMTNGSGRQNDRGESGSGQNRLEPGLLGSDKSLPRDAPLRYAIGILRQAQDTAREPAQPNLHVIYR